MDKGELHKMTDKKKILEKHSKHHSAKHMKQMKADMKKGDSFNLKKEVLVNIKNL